MLITQKASNLKAFIASLKVGDEVAFGALNQTSDKEPHFQFSTVVKITPSGRIKIKCGKTFNPKGESCGNFHCETLENPDVAREAVLKYKEEKLAKVAEVRKQLHDMVDQVESLYLLEYYVRAIKSDLRKLK